MDSNHQTANSILPTRKPYAKPRLICYGHVKDIVRGGGGNMCDAAGQQTKGCWIAEVLYGIDSPRTLLVRGWLSEAYHRRRRGWPLIALYMVCGRRVAELIQSGHIPARLFIPLFDYLVVKANQDTTRMLRQGRQVLQD